MTFLYLKRRYRIFQRDRKLVHFVICYWYNKKTVRYDKGGYVMIETKLYVPETKGRLVTRSHLFRNLDEGLNNRLTLITGPAGYGKSTLLGEWTKTVEVNKIAWVSLDPNDNHPLRFWKLILASLKQISPFFAEQLKLHYSGEEDRDQTGDASIKVLINLLNRLTEEVVLIWDDFQIVDDERILDGVTYFLEHLPPSVHIYLASRVHPSLPLSRLRIEGKLNELNMEHLRFSMEETTDFFKECTDLSLQADELTSILTQTEGWAAGLRIAALSLKDNQHYDDRVALIRKMTGKYRNIADYFLEEVFMKQPPEIQDFLLKTSILDRMNAGLVDAIITSANGLQILQQLERENLFLVSLDDEQDWYRYHHLFQEFLQMQLKSKRLEEVPSLHGLAGSWLENNSFMEEALYHYSAGENYVQAMNLLQKLIPSLPYYERLTLHKWLRMIPREWLIQSPMFFLINASSLYMTGNKQRAIHMYQWAVNELELSEHPLSEKGKNELRAGLDFLVAFRSFLEKDFESFVIASEKYLGRESSGSLLVGIGFDRDGYHPVLDIYVSDGNLLKAAEILQKLLKMWSKTKNKAFYAHLCIDYGRLLYEWNQLVEAEKYLSKALEIGKELDNVTLIVRATLIITQIEVSQNRLEMAEVKMQQLSQYVNSEKHTVRANEIALCRVQIGLWHGNIGRAHHWLQKRNLTPFDEITYDKVKDYEVLVRVLRERGQLEEAVKLTNRLLYLADDGQAHGEKIRFTMYKSLLYMEQNKVVESSQLLEEALALAEAEKYIRTFLDEGLVIKKLLTAYVSSIQNHHYKNLKKESFIYAKRLLEWTVHEKGNVDITKKHNKNLLTKKETLIIMLIQEGLSNKEIAKKMNVSLSTVKTHINNMYRKLGVNNRVLALQKARELDLF